MPVDQQLFASACAGMGTRFFGFQKSSGSRRASWWPATRRLSIQSMPPVALGTYLLSGNLRGSVT